ncbi:hypothetical protein B1A99_32840 [Cohnella sp. CIP 111063]|jgi:hypothetical protein|uniref:hypothetical protein n=1 Tax=unclassified Cohnella TaxID=2636738 RepID=UPI000B8C2053|nr:MULTISPECIES: hypothetical protein [unclassified Cohnella]OXS52644.1 hypothetical protein B1A99_32840 [Cohnella sp. CIP 111063]PRX59175.1 hypothetical protein B0G52_1323 [Cohnella sp. SGD-V74]
MLWLYYGLYLILSASVLALLNRHDKQLMFIKLLFVACVPVLGWLLPTVWLQKPRHRFERQFAEYVEQQEQEHTIRRIGVFHGVEKQRELDVVPIEDALVASRHQDRRQALIEVLKQDTIKYIEVLQLAVNNEDTETSHYAVSAIMEIKRKLLISLQELEVRYEQDQNHAETAKAYIEILTAYVKSGFLDERTKRKYQYTYLFVLTNYLNQNEEEESLFAAKLETEIELGLYSDAEQTAQRYVECYPLSEQAYMALLKYYFIVRSSRKLELTLNRLKNSPIRLSNAGLTAVRFWSEGEADGQQRQI